MVLILWDANARNFNTCTTWISKLVCKNKKWKQYLVVIFISNLQCFIFANKLNVNFKPLVVKGLIMVNMFLPLTFWEKTINARKRFMTFTKKKFICMAKDLKLSIKTLGFIGIFVKHFLSNLTYNPYNATRACESN